MTDAHIFLLDHLAEECRESHVLEKGGKKVPFPFVYKETAQSANATMPHIFKDGRTLQVKIGNTAVAENLRIHQAIGLWIHLIYFGNYTYPAGTEAVGTHTLY